MPNSVIAVGRRKNDIQNCKTFWEHLLIPAFVFFFQKLYPFRWVNDPERSTGAAAGGCILIKYSALKRAGGLTLISGNIIDDCALARLIKMKGSIWLGLTKDTISLRSYNKLRQIWLVVIRTAFHQLSYSAVYLFGTVLGMLILYIVPPFTAIFGYLSEQPALLSMGGVTWIILEG